MKLLCRFFKAVFFTCLLLCSLLFCLIFMVSEDISEQYKINRGDNLNIKSYVSVTAEYNGARLSQTALSSGVGESFEVDLKIFGIIPVSAVEVEVVDNMYVAVLGNPFGMKLYTHGVLVVEITEVETANGSIAPARDAGIKVGDYIISVDGTAVYSNEDLAEIIEASGGGKMKFEIQREKTRVYTELSALKSSETGGYHIGIWVRDSSAGIGTLTFYSPAAGVVCGLGHGICDEDTGELMTAESGELCGAEIISCTKGESGSPGELKGRFTSDVLADITLNSTEGVFGRLSGKLDLSQMIEVALKQEVHDGAAQILCTVSGSKPELYDCEIKCRHSAYFSSVQNLTVTVTDSDLIEKTGGIIQGMSGSPLLQNGKLIGAVTHVLIDDPTSGYGIFAENMLETAQISEQESELKDAS